MANDENPKVPYSSLEEHEPQYRPTNEGLSTENESSTSSFTNANYDGFQNSVATGPAIVIPMSSMPENASQAYQQFKENMSSYLPDESATRETREAIKEKILAREYEVSIGTWYRKSWEVFKQCWWGFMIIALLGTLAPMVPYVQWAAPILSYQLVVGVFIATAMSIRTGNRVQFLHMLRGFLYVLPLAIIYLAYSIIVFIGFLLCFFPGLAAMIFLLFWPYIYVEYHDTGIGMIDSMVLSCRMVFKKFLLVVLYLLSNLLILILGALALGVGLLIAIPITCISVTFAFEEIFGLNLTKTDTNKVDCPRI